MTKVIAFSLWGTNPKYLIGAIHNAVLARHLYPGWTCRFFVGRSVPDRVIKHISCFSWTEIVRMDQDGGWEGMFWRFLPALDSETTVLLSRDADSRLSYRERAAVDQWLGSRMAFHIMRDHPRHIAPIMGGMFGARRGSLKALADALTRNADRDAFYQCDQIFLRDHLYPSVRDDAMIHDEYAHIDRDARPFPTPRIDHEFVGDVFDENETRDPEFWQSIRDTPPERTFEQAG